MHELLCRYAALHLLCNTRADLSLPLTSQAAAAKSSAAAEEPPTKMSSKKKKRLDAYVKRKLKKDDRVKLIASLA